MRRPEGLSTALAASGGARSALLTDPPTGAFQQLFQSMAARGVGDDLA